MEKREISNEQLHNFKQPTSCNVSSDKSIGINNVLGVSKFPHPARLLSGFFPTFELAEAIAKQTDGKNVPTVRIFIPKHISLHVNGINHKQAEDQLHSAKTLIASLGGTVFPDIPLVIEEDEPFSEGAECVLYEVEQILLQAKDDTTTPGDHPVKRSIQSVLGSGKNRGGEKGEQNALLYTAHHPFGWHDTFHPLLFSEPLKEIEINTLPPSERPFFAIRGHIREALAVVGNGLLTQHEQINLIINMCGTAHYLPITDQHGDIREPLLTDVLHVPVSHVTDEMQKQYKHETNSMVKDNLRRARSDFEKMVKKLGRGEVIVFDQTLSDLLPTG